MVPTVVKKGVLTSRFELQTGSLKLVRNLDFFAFSGSKNKKTLWRQWISYFCSLHTRLVWASVQYPRSFWASIMLKWANKYLWIERIQSWSVYGDLNSFSMVVLGKKMDCQKVAPFLRNLPTFKKRTHQFWDSKVSGAFPGGLWAQVLLS